MTDNTETIKLSARSIVRIPQLKNNGIALGHQQNIFTMASLLL